MHLGGALLLGVLGGTWYRYDGGIGNGAGLECHAAAGKDATDFGKQLLVEMMFFQQVAKLEPCGGVRHRLASQGNAGETAQAGGVI